MQVNYIHQIYNQNMIEQCHCRVKNIGELQIQSLRDLLLFRSKTSEQNPLLPDYGDPKMSMFRGEIKGS